MHDCRPEDQKQRKLIDEEFPLGLTKELFAAFVTGYWRSFAKYAYEGYLRGGKGVLLLDWDLTIVGKIPVDPLPTRIPHPKAPRSIYIPYFYFGERSDELMLITNGQGFSPYWRTFVDNYDPEKAIVFAISWNGSNAVSFKTVTMGTPTVDDLVISQPDTPKAIAAKNLNGSNSNE